MLLERSHNRNDRRGSIQVVFISLNFFFKEGDCVTIQEGTSSTELGILNLQFSKLFT